MQSFKLAASTNFDIIDHNSFWKIHCFTFFPYKSIRDQIWHCRKIRQYQPRIIILILFVVLEHPMLHTKLPFGFREEDSLRFLLYMGMDVILVMWPGPVENNLHSLILWRLHMNFDLDWLSGFWGEIFEMLATYIHASLFYKLRLRWAK